MKAPQAPPGRWARDRRLRAALAVVAAVALWSAPSAFASRDGADFADRLLSAMRKEFGGHDEKLDQTIGETR